jgi:protein transport protein SEC23
VKVKDEDTIVQVQVIKMTTFEEQVKQDEDVNGVRFNWNIWPSSQLETTDLVVSLGCLYQPFKERKVPPVQYKPLCCAQNTCRAIINPFCQIDYKDKLWMCNFCSQINPFPPQYAGISEQMRPAEIVPTFPTIEYEITDEQCLPPIFLLVVDTCIDEEELGALKDALQMSLSLLPPNALVGLITFGRLVHVHDLDYAEFPKSYVFCGTKEISANQIQAILESGIFSAPQQQQPQGPRVKPDPPSNRFLQSVYKCDINLIQLVRELQRDPWRVAHDKRSLRSTGVALSIAVGLLECTYSKKAARIMLFVGGPCSMGPGQVTNDDLHQPIRSYHDIHTDNARYMNKAIKHYMALAERATENCHVIDIFSYGSHQTGLMEMKECFLFMDTFFQILIYYGEHIVHWRSSGYQDMPEYENFKQLLQAPVDDAQEILQARFPVPCHFDTEQGDSQARFVLSRVNPSLTQKNMYDFGLESGAAV